MGIHREGTQNLEVADAPDVTGDVTQMVWFYMVADNAAWQNTIGIGDDNQNYQGNVMLVCDSSRVSRLYHRGTEVATSVTIAVGQWYHITVYGDHAASGTIRATIYDYDSDTESTISGTGGTATYFADRCYLANDSVNEWSDAACAFHKIWERELSLNEIRTERWSGAPVSLDSLWCAHDCFDNTDSEDKSGNNNDLVIAGVNMSTYAHAPVPKFPTLLDDIGFIAAAAAAVPNPAFLQRPRFLGVPI